MSCVGKGSRRYNTRPVHRWSATCRPPLPAAGTDLPHPCPRSTLGATRMNQGDQEWKAFSISSCVNPWPKTAPREAVTCFRP